MVKIRRRQNLPNMASWSKPAYQPISMSYMEYNPRSYPSKGSLDDFKKLYKEEFNEDLTDHEAAQIAMRVLRFMHILEYGKSPEGR
jgi:hypothetical protein